MLHGNVYLTLGRIFVQGIGKDGFKEESLCLDVASF